MDTWVLERRSGNYDDQPNGPFILNQLRQRNPLKIKDNSETLIFLQLDLLDSLKPPTDHMPTPYPLNATITFFGTTESGNSVVAHVHGFRPYFYANAPNHCTEDHCQEVFCFFFRSSQACYVNGNDIIQISPMYLTLILIRLHKICRKS
jgi:hypothetical protein